MKTIVSILLMTFLVVPAICIACDLCTPINGWGYFVRHFNAQCSYEYYNTSTEFNTKFGEAISAWREHAAISISEVQSGEPEWYVYWVDTSHNPKVAPAGTIPVYVIGVGDIFEVDMEFYSHIVNYQWNWYNTCPDPPDCTFNLYKVMLHEIGHAIGFLDAPLGFDSVMEQGVCYTELQPLDKACATFLYQANPVSRVAYFTPVLQGGGVAIKWQSKYEHETSHFYIEKKVADGSYKPISGAIASSGSDHTGASYEYFDPAGTRSDSYRLIEAEKSGTERGLSEGQVALAEPSPKPPISLSERERSVLEKDIAAMLDKEARGKDRVHMVAASGGLGWVAIYPDSFSSEIAGLVTYRHYQGMNAGGASYEWVVSEYGDIKSYLQYLWNSEGHSLKYVLLVGDATQIPIDHCHDGDVGGFYADYVTDAIVADVNDDGYPEISVGRIPASTEDEVLLYVAKVLEYEGQEADNWNKDVTFFVDDRNNMWDGSGPLTARLATALSALIPPPPTHTLHYKNLMNCLLCDQCVLRTQAIDEFNAGRGTVLAFGSVSLPYSLVDWLTTHAYDSLCNFSGSQLAQNHKYAFVLGASCDMGNMLNPYPPWIFKELLFTPQQGAIACFGPSGASWQGANYDICATVLNYLYNWGSPTIGYACVSAQRAEMADELPGNAHTARSYVFYGDPAIRLKGGFFGNPPIVTVTDPDGGESYRTPGTISITWGVQADNLAGMRCTVLITYNSEGGVWTVLATGRTVDSNGNGHYDYRVPYGHVTYTHCRIQVLATDVCNNQGTDMSNGDFTIELLAKPPDKEPIPSEGVSRRAGIPKKDFLSSPFPNPFNPNTSIGFGLKEPAQVSLVIYDVAGSVVKALYRDASLAAGEYVKIWDGRNDKGARVSSGIYFLQLKTGNFSQTQRMIVLR